MRRTGAATAALVVLLAATHGHHVRAHAGPRFSDPAEGATLGASPSFVRLSFSEQPEPSLSDVRVVDTGGAVYHIGRAEHAAADPLSLTVKVKPLPRGVYIVHWRVISAVDGHATAGAYAFGVLMSPTAAAVPQVVATASRMEAAARTVFFVGVILLVGGAGAHRLLLAGRSYAALAGSGGGLALAGLALLAIAQQRNTGAAWAALFRTSVGAALIGRAVGVGAAVVAAGIATRSKPRSSRVAMTGAAVAALAAMGIHVFSGHAAAGRSWQRAAAIAVQWTHVAAIAIWVGGLAALLFGIRGRASEDRAASVRRFSAVAGAALVVVILTGVWRSIDELSAWGDLVSTAYGRAIFVKGAAVVGMAVLGAVNRWRFVPLARSTLRPLRRAAAGELALAAVAVVVAAVMGTLPPPAAGLDAAPGIVVSGADFGTTVRATLRTTSTEPGPNRFVVTLVDYDTQEAVRATRVTLSLVSLDDPAVPESSLALEQQADGSYVASASNLAFDARWRAVVHVERGAAAVEVPLGFEIRRPTQFVSIRRSPDLAPEYTVEVSRLGHIRFSLDPERAGANRLIVSCFNVLKDQRPVESIAVSIAPEGGALREVAAQRIDGSRFAADVVLARGRNRIAAVVHAVDGSRLRAAVEIDVP